MIEQPYDDAAEDGCHLTAILGCEALGRSLFVLFDKQAALPYTSFTQ